MPNNCTEVNGYWICQDGDLFHLYDPIQKCWFGFDIQTRERAEQICNSLPGQVA